METLAPWIWSAGGLLFAVHGFIALHRIYQNHVGWTLLKFIGLGIIYPFLVVSGLVALTGLLLATT